jgi:hypothetical protein
VNCGVEVGISTLSATVIQSGYVMVDMLDAEMTC